MEQEHSLKGTHQKGTLILSKGTHQKGTLIKRNSLIGTLISQKEYSLHHGTRTGALLFT